MENCMKKIIIATLMLLECFAFETGWSGRIRDISMLSSEIVTVLHNNYKSMCSYTNKAEIITLKFFVIDIKSKLKERFEQIDLTVRMENPMSDDDSTDFKVAVEYDDKTGLYTASFEDMSSFCD